MNLPCIFPVCPPGVALAQGDYRRAFELCEAQMAAGQESSAAWL